MTETWLIRQARRLRRWLFPYQLDAAERPLGAAWRPVRFSAPVAAFRHDMDDILTVQALTAVLERDAALNVPATYFIRPFKDFHRGYTGYRAYAFAEFQPHTYARPALTFALEPLLDGPDLAVRAVARRLRRQKRSFYQGKAIELTGHAPHANANYLPFHPDVIWRLLAVATALAGFDYLAEWRVAALASKGAMTPFPLPEPPGRVRAGGSETLVLPVAWDDRWFPIQAASRRFPADGPERRRLLELAVRDAEETARRCFDQGFPFIINLHPANYPAAPGWELKQELAARLEKLNAKIMPMGALCREGAGA